MDSALVDLIWTPLMLLIFQSPPVPALFLMAFAVVFCCVQCVVCKQTNIWLLNNFHEQKK